MDRAILKPNLSLKTTLHSSSINSFFSVNNLPTLTSSELQLLIKFRATKFITIYLQNLINSCQKLIKHTIFLNQKNYIIVIYVFHIPIRQRLPQTVVTQLKYN